MKKSFLTIAVLFFILLSGSLYSTLTNFNYKGIAYNNDGQILPGTVVDVQITISSSTGSYQETHSGITTDQFGGFVVEVGSGAPVGGNLAGITTTADTRIKAETREAGGTWVLSSMESLSQAMEDALNNITDFAWGLEGNAGTTAGTNFIGTTDGVATEIRVENGGTVNNSFILNTNGSVQHDNPLTGAWYVPGNARGKSAVDLQAGRSSAIQVASGDNSVIGGGAYNEASGGSATVAGGNGNIAKNTYSSVGGGVSNRATGNASTVAGGEGNTATGHYSTIAGGIDNIASGEYSTIVGGNLNEANEIYSTVGGGYRNVADEYHSTVAGGFLNTAGGDGSTASGGVSNTADGEGSTVGGGEYNAANGKYSIVAGGFRSVADKYGQNAYASGMFAAGGDAQTSVFVVRNETNDATPTILYLDGVSASEKMTLNDQDRWTFRALVVGASDDGYNFGSYIVTGYIFRNGALMQKLGVTTTTVAEVSSSYNATAVLDGTALGISVTGDATKTMRWVARVEVVQLNY